MPVPISQESTASLSEGLLSRIKSCYAAALRAQSEVAADRYDTVINIPSSNKALQDLVAAVQSSGQVSRVVSEMSARLPSDITIQDVQDFVAAFNSFSSDIESNASLFQVSINATTKRTEFVTPLSPAMKTALTNRIDAVLSEVS